MPLALRYKDPSIVPVMKVLLEIGLTVKVGKTTTTSIKNTILAFRIVSFQVTLVFRLLYHITILVYIQISKNVLKPPVLVMNMLHVRNFKDLSIVRVMKALLETGRTVKVRTALC